MGARICEVVIRNGENVLLGLGICYG